MYGNMHITLTIQNKRPDYINAFFNVVNWEEVAKRYAAAK